MVEESVGFFWRIICFIAHIAFELGIEVGVRMPGLLLQKILWPPNWFRQIEVNPITYVLGILFYLVLGYIALFVCC
jgi:hypothetical protein